MRLCSWGSWFKPNGANALSPPDSSRQAFTISR